MPVLPTFLAIFWHLFSPIGRISRLWYWIASAGVVALLIVLLPVVDMIDARWFTILFYLPFYWSLFCMMSQRCHDVGISSTWLLLLFVPIVGVVWYIAALGFGKGDPGENQYGADPRNPPPDYLVVQAVT